MAGRVPGHLYIMGMIFKNIKLIHFYFLLLPLNMVSCNHHTIMDSGSGEKQRSLWKEKDLKEEESLTHKKGNNGSPSCPGQWE